MVVMSTHYPATASRHPADNREIKLKTLTLELSCNVVQSATRKARFRAITKPGTFTETASKRKAVVDIVLFEILCL